MKTIFLFLMLSRSASAIDQNLIWRARGLEAIDKMIAMSKKSEAEQKKASFKCEMAAERAFMSFGDPVLSPITTKTTDDTMWRILVLGPKEDMTQVSLMFDKGSTKLSAWKVPTLTKDWQILAIPGADFFYISGDGCSYMIRADDPLHIKAIISPK